MTKSVMIAVAGFFGFALIAFGQQMRHADLLTLQQFGGRPLFAWPGSFRALDGWFTPGSGNTTTMSLAMAFNSVAPSPEFLPPLRTPPPAAPRTSIVPATDSSKEIIDAQRPDPVYAHGEVGFLYGVTSGKYGGSFSQEYLVGTVGNEHFSITAGASHEEWDGRTPRWRR